MKHLIILALSLLTTCLPLTLRALDAQSASPPPPVTASLSSSAAAKADTSSSASGTPDANVAPTPHYKAASHADSDGGSVRDILVPFGFFLLIGTIVWLSFSARERERRMTHETIRLMIEKGQPVPPELFLNPKIARPRNDMRRGVILIAIGIGISVFFLSNHQSAWPLGLIPTLMGVGYLIVWKAESSQRNNSKPS